MPKATVRFKELASRITGVSIPIFGVSWNPPELEREVVRQTFIFLEDRRVLYNNFAWEVEHEVAESVLAIRTELTESLKRLSETSETVASLKAMRAGCRKFLDSVRRHGDRFGFLSELGRLRATIGIQVAYLAVKYGIDIDGELAQVIPPEFRDARYLQP